MPKAKKISRAHPRSRAALRSRARAGKTARRPARARIHTRRQRVTFKHIKQRIIQRHERTMRAVRRSDLPRSEINEILLENEEAIQKEIKSAQEIFSPLKRLRPRVLEAKKLSHNVVRSTRLRNIWYTHRRSYGRKRAKLIDWTTIEGLQNKKTARSMARMFAIPWKSARGSRKKYEMGLVTYVISFTDKRDKFRTKHMKLTTMIDDKSKLRDIEASLEDEFLTSLDVLKDLYEPVSGSIAGFSLTVKTTRDAALKKARSRS